MTRSITIRDVGPISFLEIPCPEDGGVVVLRGHNGAGKSHALEAVATLARGKGKLPVRDGAVSAAVEGPGAAISIHRSTRHRGKLEFAVIGGRLSTADLVDPGLLDQAAADAHRIKALCQLTGATPDPALFIRLLGGDQDAFNAIVSQSALESPDVVTMAARVKRDIEAAARAEAQKAERAAQAAAAARDQAGAIDTTVETDEAKLQQALEQAIAHREALQAEATAAREANEAAKKAAARLHDLKTHRTGPTSAEAADSHNKARAERQERERAKELAAAKVAELEAALAEARAELEKAETALTAAADAETAAAQSLIQACEYDKLLSELEQQAADIRQEIDSESLAQAAAAVDAARQAIEAGALARKALADLERAEALDAEAADHWRREAELRDAAHGTDDVLSEIVARTCDRLRVEAGRLVTDTPRRGRTLYAELSEGERWRIALDIEIDAIGEGGLTTIPQAAWEGLDPQNRQAIAEHLKRRKTVAVTAEATDGELSATIYDP